MDKPLGNEGGEAVDMLDLKKRVGAAHAIAQALGGCYRHGGAGKVLNILRDLGVRGAHQPERTIHSALHGLEAERDTYLGLLREAHGALVVSTDLSNQVGWSLLDRISTAIRERGGK